MEIDVLLISRDFSTFLLLRCNSLASTCAYSHWILWSFSITCVVMPFLVSLLKFMLLSSCVKMASCFTYVYSITLAHSQESLYITPFTSFLLGFPFTLTTFCRMVAGSWRELWGLNAWSLAQCFHWIPWFEVKSGSWAFFLYHGSRWMWRLFVLTIQCG